MTYTVNIITIIIIIIIISQTATQTRRAASYTPKGASRVSIPVRKMKRKERVKYKSIQLKKKILNATNNSIYRN